MKVFGRSPSGPWQAAASVVVLLAVAASAWLAIGVGVALASPVWWLVAVVPFGVLLMLPFSLERLSEGRVGPTWWALGFAFVLMGTAVAVPAERYMGIVGVPVTATVGDVTCLDKPRNTSDCLYGYDLTGPDGRELPGTLKDGDRHPRGAQLDVVTDPYGVFAPLLATDLETTSVVERVALGAFAGLAVAAVVAAVQGQRRRRELALAAEADAQRALDRAGNGRNIRLKRRPGGVKRRR
ncbi:hypothetical protein [Polymorphospora rubra]|uniref:hypothetical protein n=1 Tax=Polymorphospora rubra TaxID=338584 RepID=UPI0033ECBC30